MTRALVLAPKIGTRALAFAGVGLALFDPHASGNGVDLLDLAADSLLEVLLGDLHVVHGDVLDAAWKIKIAF